MSVEANKALVRQHYEALWNQGQLPVAEALYAPATIGHSPGQPDHGGYPACEQATIVRSRQLFPDLQVVIEDQIAEGDRVVTRWRFAGTPAGARAATLPPGTRVTVTGVHIHRIAGGQIVEVWAYPDRLGLLRQLGVLPAGT